MSNAETVAACPECDNSSITHSTPGGMICADTTGEKYHCKECGNRFDTPTHRPPRSSTNSQSGMARQLLDADPEDFPP